MMRNAGFLLCGCVALLAGCSGKDAGEPAASPATAHAQATPPANPIAPRIVVQLGHQTPVVAVRWVDGGRHLASLARDGSIVFWDVANGAILDHAQVPIDAGLLNGGGVSFQSFDGAADARSLTITYRVADDHAAAPEDACPGATKPGGQWCTYTLDPMTRVVRPDPGVATPANGASRSGNNVAANFPLSPDGKLRPEQNHGDGQRGLFDETDEHLQFEDPTCISPARCRYGVNLLPAQGNGATIKLIGEPRSYFLDADLSADGSQLVRVEGLANATRAQGEILDLASGTGERAFVPTRAYHRIRSLGPRRYLLLSEGYGATDDMPDAGGGFPSALAVDPDCTPHGRCPAIESHWQMQPLDDAGTFIGLGSLDGCYRNASTRSVGCPGGDGRPDDGNDTMDPLATGLSIHATGMRGWQAMTQPDWSGQTITAIQLSPDRRHLAVATRIWDRADKPGAKQTLRLWLLDVDGHALASPRQLVELVNPVTDFPTRNGHAFSDRGTIRELSFTLDGEHIVFTQGSAAGDASSDLYIVDAQGTAKPRKITGFSRRALAAGNDRVFGLDTGQLLDLATGKPIAGDMATTPLVKAGWIDRSHLLWTAADDGSIRYWDGGDGSPLLTLYAFPDNRYFTVTPAGRYDTNLGADTNVVRWLVPDAPWQSLAAQTFMRDYYEPGLYGKLLDCRATASCAQVFKPLPPIASLDRVLPQVRIAAVRPGRDAGEAVVAIDVQEGVDAAAANGKTRSGIYNPRLFRNGRVVAMAPPQPDAGGDDLAAWRKRNALPATGGVRHLEFTVPLPTQAGEQVQVFSAYAFNEDRIKGETATYRYLRPAIAPRPPQAFVVAIGIDDYDTPRFRLNYSVADARLIASRLSVIPGFETHRLVLAGERDANGKRSRVDKATIAQVLSLLASDADRAATLQALLAAGIDASMLEPASPDDLVIVSFSGHGWADPQGGFYLIPTNGRWPDGATTPDLSSVLATTELVHPLRSMSAAEIALIIDACHSSASVADGRFKPGPMGDSGLGQLAYDKGIRILAATQADDVAMEDARLKQGLLTYALAMDGLGATGGKADLDGDGRIRLDEWLRYAVQRLPSLSQDARVGQIGPATGGVRAITFHDLPPDALRRRVQQPSLFDFNPQASPVILREIHR